LTIKKRPLIPKEEKYTTEAMVQQLYNKQQKTVILTRQFRLPIFKWNSTGMLEVCAGLLDQDNPEQCIIRETEEETLPHYKRY
jgi:8-oxo-dGTP pyrophosphatase MutT (NUDIX family)